MNISNKTTLVLYHANCMDGTCGAMWLYVNAKVLGTFDDTEFLAIDYDDPLPDFTGKHVIIVDFSIKPELIEQKINEATTLIILDHHAGIIDEYFKHKDRFKYLKYSKGDLQKITYTQNFKAQIIFDLYVSGAVLAEELVRMKPAVDICDLTAFNLLSTITAYVSDRDLWIFNHPLTKANHEVISKWGYDLDVWYEKLTTISYDEHMESLNKANERVNMRAELAAEYASKAERIKIFIEDKDGELIFWSGAAVNVPRNFTSEVGDILGKHYDFAMMYELNSEKAYCSLRSNRNTGLDVLTLAKMFGGGGHVHAAKFIIDSKQFIELLDVWKISNE